MKSYMKSMTSKLDDSVTISLDVMASKIGLQKTPLLQRVMWTFYLLLER